MSLFIFILIEVNKEANEAVVNILEVEGEDPELIKEAGLLRALTTGLITGAPHLLYNSVVHKVIGKN